MRLRAALLVLAGCAAEPPAVDEGALVARLSLIHGRPSLVALERDLGPVVQLLLRLSEDPRHGWLVRGRALEVLAGRPGPEVVAAYARTLVDPSTPKSVRRTLTRLLARIDPERGAAAIDALAAEGDPRDRATIRSARRRLAR